MGESILNEEIRAHLEMVENWLNENTLKYKDVRTVTLYDFQMDWETYSGNFQVRFNESVCPWKFSFSIGSQATGSPSIQYPMFYSPLGAPASYSAIEIEVVVAETIQRALESVFPKIMPLGLNKMTGEVLTMLNSLEDRFIHKGQFDIVRKKLEEGGIEVCLQVQPKHDCDVL